MPSGQRMVLDSHRLLIPDGSWIRWMREHADACPRVWALQVGEGGAQSRQGRTSHWITGQLNRHLAWPVTDELQSSLRSLVQAWVAS